ncbi:hypothetical protein PAQU9191_00618 [Photobacterium aquimaris]|uniref:Uncharacterized protein n=1 Tax=Photobacterium aquimaris TaxID=512643 RepID=A0A1Y6KW52_9GAMM|nr:hypothetical protein PAQU9191_00618 [Photobacterium aquimaris]
MGLDCYDKITLYYLLLACTTTISNTRINTVQYNLADNFEVMYVTKAAILYNKLEKSRL